MGREEGPSLSRQPRVPFSQRPTVHQLMDQLCISQTFVSSETTLSQASIITPWHFLKVPHFSASPIFYLLKSLNLSSEVRELDSMTTESPPSWVKLMCAEGLPSF